MKLNDLKIGNWYAWEAEGKLYYYQVTKDTFLEDEDVAISNFKPIPLSKDILLKNKFMEIFTYYPYPTFEYRGENYVVRIAFPEKSNKTRYTKPFIEVDSTDCLIEHLTVEYVHNLQQILENCRIDKEIVL